MSQRTAGRTAAIIPLQKPGPPLLAGGFTRVANGLLEALAGGGFTARQYAVLLAIVRKTYGFNKQTDDIGLTQLARITGKSKANVSRTVGELVAMRVIVRRRGEYGHHLGVNAQCGEWALPGIPALKAVAGAASVAGMATPAVADLATPPVAGLATTKDKLSKDNPSKDSGPAATGRRGKAAGARGYGEAFEAFWACYPKRRNKAEAAEAFAAVAPGGELLRRMLAALEAQKRSAEWIEAGGRFIPYPASWLAKRRWEDELPPAVRAFGEREQAFVDAFNANIGEAALPVEEWSPRAAELIAAALTGAWDLAKWAGFWRFVRDECRFKGSVSFEWLMARDNFVRVRRGEFQGR